MKRGRLRGPFNPDRVCLKSRIRGPCSLTKLVSFPPACNPNCFSVQPKLLRVLEDGSLRRVGASQERRVNVRIIAATNRDLAEEVRENRFREDLLYRINVMAITLPPLRAHRVDIPLLIRHFLPREWQ